MDYPAFLARVIADGERTDRVVTDTDHHATDAGTGAGYDACRRTSTPADLQVLLDFAELNVNDAFDATQVAALPDADAYGFARAFHAAVAWVCNVVSALLLNEGLTEIVRPTSRGVLACAKLLDALDAEGRPHRPQWFFDAPDVGTPECLCSFCAQPIAETPHPIFRVVHPARDMELRCCLADACTAQLLVNDHGGELFYGRPS